MSEPVPLLLCLHAVFANLRQADLITSEDSERLSGLSDLVRVQGSKSLEILTKTADALRIAGLETESKLLTGIYMQTSLIHHSCVI